LKDTRFFKQADLLLQLLPFFSKNNIFAIKGGTVPGFFEALILIPTGLMR